VSVVSVVRCEVEVSATSWSLVHRSPTDCGASFCVIWKPRERGGPGRLGAVAPNKKNRGVQIPGTSLPWRPNFVVARNVCRCSVRNWLNATL